MNERKIQKREREREGEREGEGEGEGYKRGESNFSFPIGTDGANNPNIISYVTLKKYCKDDRFTAGRDAIYGSFVFVFSKSRHYL